MNLKAHAPGCPVIIVGTHSDAVNIREDDIRQNVHHIYSNSSSFPEIADVCCVSNTNGSRKTLRNKIYSVATCLRYDRWNRC